MKFQLCVIFSVTIIQVQHLSDPNVLLSKGKCQISNAHKLMGEVILTLAF